MNKIEYKYCSTKLRELFREFNKNPESIDRKCSYRFGICWNPDLGFFHLYDGMKSQSVATFKISRDKLITRYEPKYLFEDLILNFRLADYKPVFVKSENLTRNDSMINARLIDNISRTIREGQDFLAPTSLPEVPGQAGVYILSIPLSPPMTAPSIGTGLTEQFTPTGVLQVSFTQPPTNQESGEIINMVSVLRQNGRHFSTSAPITAEGVRRIYNAHVDSDRERRFRESIGDYAEMVRTTIPDNTGINEALERLALSGTSFGDEYRRLAQTRSEELTDYGETINIPNIRGGGL